MPIFGGKFFENVHMKVYFLLALSPRHSSTNFALATENFRVKNKSEDKKELDEGNYGKSGEKFKNSGDERNEIDAGEHFLANDGVVEVFGEFNLEF